MCTNEGCWGLTKGSLNMQLASDKTVLKKEPKVVKLVGKKDAYNELIEQYLPFASSIASKVARLISCSSDCYEDILCNARLGLLEAAQRFDLKFKVDFKTFAYYRIKGAIYDGLRKTGWIPRSLYTKLKLEEASHNPLQKLTERIAASAKNVKDDVEAVYDSIHSLASMYITSLDAMEDFEVEDQSAKRDIEHKAEFQKIKEKMRDAIEALPEKERKLVKMYYFQNRTLQEIGVRLGLSKSWTSRLHARALDLLFKKLNSMDNKMSAGEFEESFGKEVVA
ncbi:MAG TPA: RNA polymerase subunit sigma-70 [Deltaproteobacteria bacterium]|nr:RNA polymerase subunit sigma-70 [Deltaproteobacteria bacterium]